MQAEYVMVKLISMALSFSNRYQTIVYTTPQEAFTSDIKRAVLGNLLSKYYKDYRGYQTRYGALILDYVKVSFTGAAILYLLLHASGIFVLLQ